MAGHVLLKELATEWGVDRTTVKRYARRHGIAFVWVRDADTGNQQVQALTVEDAEAMREARTVEGYGPQARIVEANGAGFFYVVQLLPTLQPGRVKLGHATDVEARLGSYRTVCPEACIVGRWACRKSWEAAAIRAATAGQADRIGQEVFLAEDVDAVVAAAERFFGMMGGRPHD